MFILNLLGSLLGADQPFTAPQLSALQVMEHQVKDNFNRLLTQMWDTRIKPALNDVESVVLTKIFTHLGNADYQTKIDKLEKRVVFLETLEGIQTPGKPKKSPAKRVGGKR